MTPDIGHKNGDKPAKKASSSATVMEWDNNSKEGGGTKEGRSNNNMMDPQLMQQLLSNFQNGTTLSELRQELAASQASMKESRHVLQNAAKNFFQRS
jgi:hypothetical protein